MDILPENVDLCLFVCTYLFSKCSNSRTTFSLLLQFPFLSPSLLNEQFTMFLSPASPFNPIVYPSTSKPYPPAILVKHLTWFLKDANLFVCHDHILYSVHQSLFNQSPLFQEIILYGESNEIGTNPYHPIPFDTLTKEVFDNFLYLLYFRAEHLEHLTPAEWLNIKRLCTDWYFPRLTATIIRQLVTFLRRLLPPLFRVMANSFPVYRVFDEQEHLSRRIRGRTILIKGSSDEEDTIVEDNES
jgi:hypothetical protein